MNLSKKNLNGIRPRLYTAAILAMLAILLFSILSHSLDRKTFTSSEVKFTDNSAHGMEIVPASCPSDPHYAGECSVYSQGSYSPGYSQSNYGDKVSPPGYSQATYNSAPSCSPQYYCSGGNLFYQDVSCSASQYQACSYGCTGGACLPTPSITFVPFGGGAAYANGHLHVIPTLVSSGTTVKVYWNTQNASACTVTGTNGDRWSAVTSGPGGLVSRPIRGQTVYTLNCTALPGATPATITESATVNIIPNFQEQ